MRSLRETPLFVAGMVHLPPLPGAPRCRADAGACLAAALEDAGRLREAGVDALLVENHGDAPFAKDATPPHVPAFLAICARELRQAFRCPVGINCLRNDALGALGAAAMAGASFIRVNVLLGVTATDQGLIEGPADRLLRYRTVLAAPVEILADVDVKFGTPLYRPETGDLVRSLVTRGGADGLIVTGATTGDAPPQDAVRRVRAAAPPAAPVIVGSGVDVENLEVFAASADGFIVGTHFKQGGRVDEPVDGGRARRFMEAVQRLRHERRMGGLPPGG